MERKTVLTPQPGQLEIMVKNFREELGRHPGLSDKLSDRDLEVIIGIILSNIEA
jgi:hypothetical protein